MAAKVDQITIQVLRQAPPVNAKVDQITIQVIHGTATAARVSRLPGGPILGQETFQ